MILAVLIIYLILLLGIAGYSARFASKGIAEYFIGNYTMNKYIVALSAVASGRSAWLLLSFSALAYNLGLAAIWAVIGYITVESLMFWHIAPKMRQYSEGKNIITIPDFFISKLGDKYNLLRIIMVIVILIFMITYIASQFVAGGKAFAISTGISEDTGIILTAIIVLSYTLIGGFLAVSWSDVLQAIIMLMALILLPVLSIWNYGGWSKMHTDLLLQVPTFFELNNIAFASICGFIGIGLGALGSPRILVRYLSIKNVTDFKFVTFLGTFWNILMAIGALFIGFAGRAYFPNLGFFPNGDVENLYPIFGELVLNPFLFGLIITSIFAAIMSTVDAQLLVAASAIIRDIYQQTIKKNTLIANDKLVRYSRIIVLFITVIAIFLSIFAKIEVFNLVLFAWGGLGTSIGATLLLVLFWKHTNWNGVVAGTLTGIMSTFVWKNIPALEHIIYELIPTFCLTLIITILVSWLSRNNTTSNNESSIS